MKILMYRNCLLGILLTLASQSAPALTGEQLQKQCMAADASVERRLCESYILGALSGANMIMVGVKMLHPDSTGYPTLFCMAPSVPTPRLVSAVVEYMKSHQEGLKYDAGSEVLLAFREAFPCR